ncbi:hypothetical protein BaRGS_00028477 [Batillaria attramentaria]|uniref:C1q domain-containing protein n=1 Tax=Batillaria attramentaria TaxID=370345 RepID=A0ABD0JZS7_9CAEN
MASVCFLVTAFSLTVHLSSGYHDHLYRRSDDTNPLSDVVAQQAADIQTNQAKIATLEHKLAAMEAQIHQTPYLFTAHTGTTATYNTGQPILFHHIMYNLGSMYDSLTGTITIPRDGVYLVSIRPDPNGPQNLTVQIRVNGTPKFYAYDEHGGPTGVSAALNLKAGDRITAESDDNGTEVESGTLISVVLIRPY